MIKEEVIILLGAVTSQLMLRSWRDGDELSIPGVFRVAERHPGASSSVH